MRRAIIFLIIVYICSRPEGSKAQTGGKAWTIDPAAAAVPGGSTNLRTVTSVPATALPADTTLPSPEEFVNAIFHTVVDSSFSKYYLSGQAAPCSFVKFDYDEWVKYALRETVTMEVLNELAERSYNDRKPMSWRKERLEKAVCINEKKIDSILDPALYLRKDGTPVRQKAVIHKQFKKWSQLPPEQRTVFFFSRPLFTGDGQYAIIDLDYRCDAQQCGAGSICLFHREGRGWKLIGQKIR